MRVHNSLFTSLRTALASHQADRDARSNLAALRSGELSPAAEREIMVIMAHREAVRPVVSVPAQRSGGARRQVGTDVSS